MDHLEKLESKSVYILREAYREFKNLCMLWSIGKDSTVLLWLARKAFFGHVPMPLVHIDTHFKIPEMIEYRDKLAREWRLNMVYGENTDALSRKQTYKDGNVDRLTCCKFLKTEALKHTLAGDWLRYRMNHTTGAYEIDANKEPYTGVIAGVRADEEGAIPWYSCLQIKKRRLFRLKRSIVPLVIQFRRGTQPGLLLKTNSICRAGR